MIKLENLETAPDLNTLLEPKKKIYNLIQKVNGSMAAFHKEVKTSKEIEDLAQELLVTISIKRATEQRSHQVSFSNLIDKLKKTKNIKINNVDDFI